jgi:hypothetical protein
VTGDLFERIMEQGRSAVLAGDHRAEAPPSEGGRWGTSVVAMPTGLVAEELDRLTTEVIDLAGRCHWRSARRGRAHLTVRALEPFTTSVIHSERASRYRRAMREALARWGPVELDFDGIVLAPTGVMATASSPDARAHRLRSRFAEELGAGGWLEDTYYENGRDPIWYCTLVHFTGPIADPVGLVRWVEDCSTMPIGRESYPSLALCQWSFDGDGMAPTVVGTEVC